MRLAVALEWEVSKASLIRWHLDWNLKSQPCSGEGEEYSREWIQTEKNLEWSRNRKTPGVAGAWRLSPGVLGNKEQMQSMLTWTRSHSTWQTTVRSLDVTPKWSGSFKWGDEMIWFVFYFKRSLAAMWKIVRGQEGKQRLDFGAISGK